MKCIHGREGYCPECYEMNKPKQARLARIEARFERLRAANMANPDERYSRDAFWAMAVGDEEFLDFKRGGEKT